MNELLSALKQKRHVSGQGSSVAHPPVNRQKSTGFTSVWSNQLAGGLAAGKALSECPAGTHPVLASCIYCYPLIAAA